MLRKYFYGILAAVGLAVLILFDVLLIVPLTSNPAIVLAVTFVFYIYLVYLVIFRKIV